MRDKWYFLVGMLVVVAVTTLFVRMPLPSRGYFNFGDVAVVFAGLTLGRRGGALAGGMGSALADILAGAALFAPLTMAAKGLEGYICGLARGRHGVLFYLFLLAGVLAMVAVYFTGEVCMPQIGWAGAVAELIPNLIQAAGGCAGGKALYFMFTRTRLIHARESR